MKILLTGTWVLFLCSLLAACNNNDTSNSNVSPHEITDSLPPKKDTLKKVADLAKDALTGNEERQTDPFPHIKRFITDDYPVPYEMIKEVDSSMKSGEISSAEGAWFSNDTLKQTLVFILYTDGHRLVTYHFLDSDIPGGIIDRMELHTADGELATFKQKQKYFRGFLSQAKKTEQSYFRTKKGFKPGDSKKKALQVYGKPDRTRMENGIEKCEWDFTGDILYDGKTNLKGKPLAKDSYGHQTIMFFRNNRLTGIIFHNDIP